MSGLGGGLAAAAIILFSFVFLSRGELTKEHFDVNTALKEYKDRKQKILEARRLGIENKFKDILDEAIARTLAEGVKPLDASYTAILARNVRLGLANSDDNLDLLLANYSNRKNLDEFIYKKPLE